MTRKTFLSLLLFLTIAALVYGQKREDPAVDSLKRVLTYQNGQDRINSYNELSWIYKNFDVDSALIFGRMALWYAESDKDDLGLSSAFNSIANSFEALGHLDSAEYYQHRSLEKKLLLGDSLKIAQTLNNLGIIYDQQGRFSTALKNYFQALRIYESYSEDPYDIAMVLGNIGIVYKKQKAFDQVLEYYQRALEIYKETESQFGQVVTQGNIGSVLNSLLRHDESISYSFEALKGYKALGYLRYVPYMQHNLAVAKDSLGFLSEAEKFYLLAVEGHLDHQNVYELANTYSALANNYLKQKKYERAQRFAKKALEASKIANAADFEVNALKYLAESNAFLGLYKEAYNNFKSYAAGKDSLFEKDKTRQVFELRTEYETEKKEQQIELQQSQLGQKDAKLERNQILIITLGMIAVLAVVIVLLVRNKARKKQLLLIKETQLQLREAEINAVINSQEKERNRFAQDLHDGFGQLISVLKMNLSNLSKADGKVTAERVKVFEQSEGIINEMYKELRNICFDLMPQTLVKKGLAKALQELGSRITQTGKMTMEVMIFDLEDRLPELVEVSLYRVAQEWVNNIIKYADADNITLQFTRDSQELTMTIEDNGRGFDAASFYEGKGNGWRNISSRINLINAQFDLDTHMNSPGSMVTINVPIESFKNVPSSTDSFIIG